MNTNLLETTEKNNPQFFLVRQTAYILSLKIYSLYQIFKMESILDRYECKTNIRGPLLTKSDFSQNLDINNSRHLAKYDTMYKEIENYRIGLPEHIEFKGTVYDVFCDLVEYLKYDFTSNQITDSKRDDHVCVTNFLLKFARSQS